MTTTSKARTAVWAALQPFDRHERDRAEVLGERHAEPVLEDPPDDAGRLRRCGIGKLDLGADDPGGLQLLERDEQHRVDLEHDLAVHDGRRIRLVPEQVHHPRVGKRQRPRQGLLHARLGEQRLEATRQPVLQREGDGSGDRGHPVGQHIRQARLDIERGDDLRADACRQRVDDLGLFEGVGRESREPIGVERDLVRPHGNRRDQDRGAREDQADPRQDAAPPRYAPSVGVHLPLPTSLQVSRTTVAAACRSTRRMTATRFPAPRTITP